MEDGAATTVTLAGGKTFTLTCTNAGGSDSAQTTVATVPAPVAPVLGSFTASPSTVTVGVPTSVAWTWTFANAPSPTPACEIDQGVGTVEGGAATAVTLAAATTFTLTCTNAGGSDSAQTTVATVPPPVAPIIGTFAATPASVTVGTPTSVAWSWTFANAPSPAPTCEIDQGVGTVEGGAATTVTLAAAKTFTLTCTNVAGSDSAQTTVATVPAPVAPVLATFTALPASVTRGTPTRLTWAWTYSNTPAPSPTCQIDNGVGTVSNGGSTQITLSAEGTFTLTCGNGGGTATAQATVAVLPPLVIAAAAGSAHTCAILQSGAVRCWGHAGAVGDGSYLQRSSPVDVVGLSTGVTAIAAGGNHACGLVSGGGLKCWGGNSRGQLGEGTNLARTAPVDVSGLGSGVTAVTAGDNHSCALLAGGAVRCWGDNYYGQLGDGTTTARWTPVDVSGLASGVLAIAAGGDHTCAVLSGGAVRCWGDNGYGQVGDGTSTKRTSPVDVSGLASDVAAVTLGHDHTCALLASGGAKCWGGNTYGQLGDGTTSNQYAPATVSGMSAALAVAAGANHTCALDVAGGVRCWGLNGYGQLGDGSELVRRTPVGVSGLGSGVDAITAGGEHTCAVLDTGALRCWGSRSYGQLGDGLTNSRTTPVDVAGLSPPGAIAVGAAFYHGCAALAGRGARCWGYNAFGQLGDNTSLGTVAPVTVRIGSELLAIAPGANHTCALVYGGGVWCWGDNSAGQVGDGSLAASRPTPVDVSGLTSGVTAIATEYAHTCAVLADGGVKCWGMSYGDTPVDVAGLSAAASVATGYLHTCALLAGGGVQCWGDNTYGQIGDGTATARTAPTDVTGLGSGVTAISGGMYGSCAIVLGAAQCWGDNRQGQLGDGTTTVRRTPVGVSGLASGVLAVSMGVNHACAVVAGGSVRCWGSNDYGQLGDGTFTNRTTPVSVSGLSSGARAVVAAYRHTCALLEAGVVRCWGDDTHGQTTGFFPGYPHPTVGLGP